MRSSLSRWIQVHMPATLRRVLRSARRVLRKVYYAPLDALHASRQKGSLIPPPSLMFVGDGNFLQTGEEFKGHFINIGGLKPEHRILDVGCGVGRMALPLLRFLSPDGEYQGFDIVSEGIEWCQKTLTPKFPNFHFRIADIFNQGYNPGGKVRASEFVFPYQDASFDFVFATSVFTHLLESDVANYLGQISRVLRPGGRSLITFFILNEESRLLMSGGASTLNFKHNLGGAWTADLNLPENAVAYQEEEIRSLYERSGLVIENPIHGGSWCGRSSYLSYQDIIVASKGRA